MGLRKATMQDYQAILELMEQEDDKNKIPIQWDKLELMLKDPEGVLMVYESEGVILGIMAAHIVPIGLQRLHEFQEAEEMD